LSFLDSSTCQNSFLIFSPVLSSTGHTQPVTSTVFGPEGKVLVSGYVLVIDKDSPSPSSSFLRRLRPHTRSFVPLPSCRSTDRQIKVWDVSSGVLVHSIASSLGEISSVDIDYKGHHLLVSSKDNSNTLFDLRMVSYRVLFPLHFFAPIAESRVFLCSVRPSTQTIRNPSKHVAQLHSIQVRPLFAHHRRIGGE